MSENDENCRIAKDEDGQGDDGRQDQVRPGVSDCSVINSKKFIFFLNLIFNNVFIAELSVLFPYIFFAFEDSYCYFYVILNVLIDKKLKKA